jgi:tetratricopeptide (TPR) repeat protein
MTRHALAIGVALSLLSPVAFAAPAGEIVSLVGKGEYRDVGASNWSPAKIKQPLEGGSFVRTLVSEAKMAVLLVDRTQFTLQGVATAQVKNPAEATAGKSIVDMVKGAGRFQTKTPTAGFKVGTPTGLAAIRGTEWLMEVDDERSIVTVVEGEVQVSNEFGEVSVLPDEQAILEKGKAPTKRRIQNAKERVQWVSAMSVETVRYPELKKLPAGAEGASLAAIAGAVDAGELSNARTLAKAHVARADLTLATGHFLAADLALYFGAAAEAQALLAEAGRRFPAEKRTSAYVAWAALFADQFDVARKAAAEAIAKAPDTLESQLAAGEVARLDGDYYAARAAFRRATQIDPKDWRGWHGRARVEGERGNVERSRRSFGEALALGERALVLGERGALEASATELEDARKTLDAALALQPDDYTTWAGLGYARLRSGDPDGAIDALVRATLIEPRYARAHIHLAVAYWQQGLHQQAFSSLQRASEADPRDPLPYQYAAMMRGDLMQPGLAAEQAREALVRVPYAKSLEAIAPSTRGVANLGSVFAQFGLEAWALRNAQESYDPFWAGSHFFLADRYSSRYARNSELFQGFLTDPTSLGGSNRFQTLVARPDAYGTLAWRGSTGEGTRLTEPALTVNGLFADGRAAGFAEAAHLQQWRTDGTAEDEASSYTIGLGAKPRHDIGLFAYGNRLVPDTRAGVEDPRGNYTLIDGWARRADAGVSWRQSADRLFWLKVGAGEEDNRVRQNIARSVGTDVFVAGSVFTSKPERRDLQARGLMRFEGGHEISLGYEQASWDSVDVLERDAFGHPPATGGVRESVTQDIRDDSRLVALAGRARLGMAIVEAQVDRTSYDKTNDILVRRDYANQLLPLTDNHSRDETFGRVGVELRALPGTTFRLAWQQWLRPASIGSLTATATAGIMVDDRFVLPGGTFERVKGQFEWEAARGLLLTAYADRQEIDNLYSPLLGVLNNRPDSSNLERLRNRSFNNLATLDVLEGYPDLSRGELREAGATVNVIVNRHLSLYAEGARANSENTGAYPGKLFAYLPKSRAALGATFFTDFRLSIGAKAIYRGERYRDEANSAASRLPAEWDGAVQLYWETADKRWSAELLVSRIGAKSANESVGIALIGRF